jgi:hypothetical protein
MKMNRNGQAVLLPRILLDLQRSEMTGNVTIQDKERTLRLFVKGGEIVCGEGMGKDGQLLEQIASRKGLNRKQVEKLEGVRKKDSRSFGEILVAEGLISESGWRKFQEIKVRALLAAALKMDSPQLTVRNEELAILPVNFIQAGTIRLLLQTIRRMKSAIHLKRVFDAPHDVPAPTPDANSLRTLVPLNESEKTILAFIDGQKTIDETVQGAGVNPLTAYRSLYVLLSFGFVHILPKKGGKPFPYHDIIHLYLGLLNSVATRFRKETGKRFDSIFGKCKAQLTGQSKVILKDLNLSEKNRQAAVDSISKRLDSQPKGADQRLVLYASFNKLLYLLLLRMKKDLGRSVAEKSIVEMMRMLVEARKHRTDQETMNYVMANLQDYLKQMRS